jgi:hypothetical protein
MADAKPHEGSCHCKAVRFQATLALGNVTECNCSICSRVGALRTFIPAENFELLSGEDSLTDYQFGKGHIHHTFCKVCGVHAFASGKGPNGADMYAVNVRCLEGVDAGTLEVTQFDGRKL